MSAKKSTPNCGRLYYCKNSGRLVAVKHHERTWVTKGFFNCAVFRMKPLSALSHHFPPRGQQTRRVGHLSFYCGKISPLRAVGAAVEMTCIQPHTANLLKSDAVGPIITHYALLITNSIPVPPKRKVTPYCATNSYLLTPNSFHINISKSSYIVSFRQSCVCFDMIRLV